MNASPISNVSDTARWVAAYRASESARLDALRKSPRVMRPIVQASVLLLHASGDLYLPVANGWYRAPALRKA